MFFSVRVSFSVNACALWSRCSALVLVFAERACVCVHVMWGPVDFMLCFLNSAGDLKLRAVCTHQLRQSVQVHQHLRPGGADFHKLKAVDAESREHAQLPRQEGPAGV